MLDSSHAPQVELADDGQANASLQMLAIGWRRKWLLLLGLICGLTLGSLYASRLVPEYQSSMKLLVVKKRPDALPSQGDNHFSQMDDYLATHQVLIKSPMLVGNAVRKGNLRSLPTFAALDNPTEQILAGLHVAREATEGGATNILNISFRSASSEDCPAVLNAVTDSYSDFLKNTYRDVSSDTFKLINEAKEMLENKLGKKEQELRDFRLKHPDLIRNKEGVSPSQERLFNLESKRSALMLSRAEAESRLERFRAAMHDGKSRAELLAMIPQTQSAQTGHGHDPANPAKETLLGLMLKEQQLLTDFGAEHPQVKAIRQQIEFVRQNYPILPQAPAPADPVEAHLVALRQELATIKGAEQAITGVLHAERAGAHQWISVEMQEDVLRKDIASAQQLFQGVIHRLEEINLLKDFGGYDTRCLHPAGEGKRIGPRVVPIFMLFGALGLAIGIGLAYLAEISDRSFRDSEEVRRCLGLPIVGQIPRLNTKRKDRKGAAQGPPSPLAATLVTFHQPKSRSAEAYRAVRTGLFFSTQGKGHKVVQITSPNVGDGKSTLASNLAISIAQADKKVLLIDADLRRPTQHQVFGLPGSRGLSALLTGKAALKDVLLPSGVDGLLILPCGELPANPAELLSLPAFKDLLDELRERFDYVLVDSPPLLAVTDPCMVATHVDGVLLNLTLSRNGRPAARRAREILATLGANVIGAVINDRDGTGGDTGYGYGYGEENTGGYYRQAIKGEDPPAV
jgi:capsular exopolysaccharide synthesis family protein